MTAKYCLDTSGVSNPFTELPEDIHVSLWASVRQRISDGVFCWNAEIAKELSHITGALGDCLQGCNGVSCLEIGAGTWPWQEYLKTLEGFRTDYKDYISEYNANRADTVGVTDVSIVALAKTMKLPVVSMEKPNLHQPSLKRMRIPELCTRVKVDHLTFNQFLRAEGIRA
jgi:Domain of unknown function (DUF4411)